MTQRRCIDSAVKRARGRYYTERSPFNTDLFALWARRAGLPCATLLEPFAGANGIVGMLKSLGLCRRFASFDISPGVSGVRRRDTISRFPVGYGVCVTNPPWLAKNSATRRGFSFPWSVDDDLYKVALRRCLDHCGYVGALVPESFIRSRFDKSRLESFVSVRRALFDETDHPVGLALFVPDRCDEVDVWSLGDVGEMERLGTLGELNSRYPRVSRGSAVFNDPRGNVGLAALDNTVEASIRFCRPEELDGYEIGFSSRAFTRISVRGIPDILGYNRLLRSLRSETCDVVMTAYRGLRRDGLYRRRLDWGLARGVILRSS